MVNVTVSSRPAGFGFTVKEASGVVTVIVFVISSEQVPLVAVKVTLYVPAVAKGCVGFFSVDVPPSPKSHS